jgi:hypothetical protein
MCSLTVKLTVLEEISFSISLVIFASVIKKLTIQNFASLYIEEVLLIPRFDCVLDL